MHKSIVLVSSLFLIFALGLFWSNKHSEKYFLNQRARYLESIKRSPKTLPTEHAVRFAGATWALPLYLQMSPTTPDGPSVLAPEFDIQAGENGIAYHVVYMARSEHIKGGQFFIMINQEYPNRDDLLGKFKSDKEFVLAALSMTQSEVNRQWGAKRRRAKALMSAQDIIKGGVLYDGPTASTLIWDDGKYCVAYLFDGNGRFRGYLAVHPNTGSPDIRHDLVFQLVSGLRFDDTE